MKKIVIVEDELFMREELQHILEKEGYDTFSITKFCNVIDEIIAASPDLVLLDLNLPGISGFEICKGIRHKSNVPILVLTGRDQMKDELHALDIGADEYINKPCHKERLLARITNLLRRLDDRRHFAEIKDISLDLQTYTINIKGKAAILPGNQGKIMELLLENYQELVTKEMLLNKLWGTTEYIDENALHVNMTRLKKSLHNLDTNYKINTIRGKGYSLEPVGDNND
ncbi:response regulator transcription factor [Clostridium gasigenes]|uniref:response regulator transcription factor n=1 Tax=Clostridium gasigenes TaxID=94869 RepID=UPI001C0DBA3F|nr:response regulator transcription factor [Clostridium gasigenes]MBU3137396.1 response regulator transcription factor [Clostridium gasigenes]